MAVREELIDFLLDKMYKKLTDQNSPPVIYVYDNGTQVATIKNLSVEKMPQPTGPITVHGEDSSSNDYYFDELRLYVDNGLTWWALWNGSRTHKGKNDKLVIDWTFVITE